MSVPLDSSDLSLADPPRENLLSPTSGSHPLPPRPISNLDTAMSTSAEPTDQSIKPQQPRTRGGFEVDDDEEDEDDEDQQEDLQDEADVYDPEAILEITTSTPVPDQTTINRQTQSPIERNGITPVPAPVDSPTGASSSHLESGSSFPSADAGLAVSAVLDPRAATPTPLPSVNGHLPASRSSRLPHDTIGILEDRIKEDSRGDPEAYLELIQEYKNRNRQDDVRATYEAYLSVFTTDATQWLAYANWENANDQRGRIEGIFSRVLEKTPNVDLWMMYINYIRRQFSRHRDESVRLKTIGQAFDIGLLNIGLDKDAGFVWQEYIAYLQTTPGTLGATDWESASKTDAIRNAYQRAIAIPTEAVTQLWRDYDLFENGISKSNGRKHLQEMSASYMTARQAYHQLSRATTGLNRTTTPRLPPRPGFQGDDQWSRQLDLWYDWLDFEKSDPLVLKDDDRPAYLKRIVYVYKQALMALQFWPGMWYAAVDFCFESGMDKEATTFLEDGIKANPESPLLAFKMADRIENTTQNDETSDPGARERMKKVRAPYDRVVTALYDLHQAATRREADEIRQLEAASETNGDGSYDEINAATILSRKAALDAQIATVKSAGLDELDLLMKLISHVWIAIARATRRVQGRGEGAHGFRAVFVEARKRGRLTSHFYVECAAIEWQLYDDTIGNKILERGMKLFPEDNYLPLHYIKYLIDTKKDVTNARGVFETTVTRLTAAGQAGKTRALFRFMHEYESRFGELSQIQKLEARMREVFPEDTPMGLFSDRFATEPFDPVVRFPIVSRSQVRSKTDVLPTIEADYAQSPALRVLDPITVNSPKRPLPDDFEDNQARKIARGESPLKGAAGRKMNQQRQMNGPVAPAPPPMMAPLPPAIHHLLTILPRPHLYSEVRFSPEKMLDILRNVHLPAPGQIQIQHTPQSQHAWPQQQSHQQGHPFPPPIQAPHPGYPHMQPPTPVPGHYPGAPPFRFA